MEYSQNGNYLAIASLAVMLLSKIGIITTTNDVLLICAGVGAFIGVVKQWIDHRKLAVGASRFGSVKNF